MFFYNDDWPLPYHANDEVIKSMFFYNANFDDWPLPYHTNDEVIKSSMVDVFIHLPVMPTNDKSNHHQITWYV